MQISKYGIVLQRLKVEDLELVRQWRNADHVRLNMDYQKIISSAEQKTWFEQLDKTNNFYFVISSDSKKVGVVNLKNINTSLVQAEAGIFIGETEYLNTLIPILATITIMEFAFETLQLKTLYAKIASNNVKAILFNESIGYKKKNELLTEVFDYYYTTPILFKEATKNIRETLDKLN
jgi:UDP-4-amino-4,6-dideoxy-N-acetyl-beta-L-altrosamine N-acetyltransferase